MARQATFVKEGQNIDFVLTANVAVGDVVVIGSKIGIALTAGSTGDTIAVKTNGVWTMAAVTGTAFSVGDTLYWDDTANNLTKTSTSNTLVGVALEAKESAGTTAKVLFA